MNSTCTLWDSTLRVRSLLVSALLFFQAVLHVIPWKDLIPFHSLHTNNSIHIHDTVPHTFFKELSKRICLTITGFLS